MRPPVDVVGSAGPVVAEYRVLTVGAGKFRLEAGSAAVAVCADPRPLSDWAFRHGATSVRHDYHLGLCPP
jgi:hypothetical protein